MLVRPLVRSVVSPLVRGVTQRMRGKIPVVLGPELAVNGDFDDGATGWSVTGTDASHIATFAGGTFRYQSTTTSPQLVVSEQILVLGKVYEVVITVTAWVSGSLKVDSLGVAGATAISGTGVFVRRGAATQVGFNITRNSTNVDITVDKISVREVLSGG